MKGRGPLGGGARRQGVIRADVDINAAVDLLVGALYAAHVAGEERAFDVESVVDTLLAGMATPSVGALAHTANPRA